MQSGLVLFMLVGVCSFCQKEYRKRERTRKFCSLICSSKYNHNGFKKIPLPSLDENFAEFIGICLGDGYVGNYQVSVTLHSELDKEYILYVVSLARKLFPDVVISLIHKKELAIDIRISSKAVADYMKSMGVISHNKKVPLWILSNKTFIRKCIRGLIDTDGSFIWHKYKVKGKSYAYPKISFTNTSDDLLNFMYTGLIKLGFSPKRTYQYQIWLHSQKDIKKYVKEIGFSNRKANILKLYE